MSPNWGNFKIFPVSEENLLTIAVERTTLSFKLSKVKQLILKNQEQLKTEKVEDQIMQLLKEINALEQIKKQLASSLGQIILK